MNQARRRRRSRRNVRVRRRLNVGRLLITVLLAAALICALVFLLRSVITGAGESIYEKSDEKILKYIQKQTDKEVYFPNIYVDGIEIGGLTRTEAKDKLDVAVELPSDDAALTIASDNESYNQAYTLDKFGIYFDLEGAMNAAYEFGRSGTDEENIARFKSLETQKQDFQVMYYDKDMVRSVADSIAAGINVEPVNSTVSKTSSGFQVTSSAIGYSMDADKLYNDLIAAIESRNFNSTVSFSVTQNDPQYTEADFQYIDTVIGSCYSAYKKDGDDNRLANLRNGCEKIDGVVLYPDEVFSTNEHFNPCTYENGWRSAATIVNGKIEDSIGGGMCQVSSALYQAVLEAEIEVVERFNHSIKVGYADYAYDATLAGDYKDLKFKNTTGYPMYIESYLTSSNVVIKLYGYEQHDAGHTVEFQNKLIKTTPPEEPIVTEDDTKPEGYEEYTVTALDGKTYELYKYVYENGVLTDTVKVNTSTYVPRRAEIVKGTMKEDETATETTTIGSDTGETAEEASVSSV